MSRTVKQIIKQVQSSSRANTRCLEAGIVIKFNRRLMKITDTRWIWGGHLADGKLHYRNAVEVSGNTYAMRDLLKAAGFKWDAQNKVWFGSREVADGISCKIARKLAGR